MSTANDTSNNGQPGNASALHDEYHQTNYYLLSSDFYATTRLALQQYLWQRCLGFDIHPSIPLGPSATVADVACGTGMWLFEVGRQLGPSSDLHGFDINLHQAPPTAWLPKNVTLHQWDLFGDVPAEFVGKFDLVHVRLITIAIKNNNPEVVMRNLNKLLKPGGYLQWDEIEVHDSFITKVNPDLQVPALDNLLDWIHQEFYVRAKDDWKINAIELLERNGFEMAKLHDLKHTFMDHMELLKYSHDQVMMLWEQYARRAFPIGSDQSIELLKSIADAAKDSEKGAVIVFPPFCWVARKTA